jgi:hypothetical protein
VKAGNQCYNQNVFYVVDNVNVELEIERPKERARSEHKGMITNILTFECKNSKDVIYRKSTKVY